MKRVAGTLVRGLLAALVVAAALAVTADEACAQGKIGWVDLDRILAEYSEFKEVEELFRKDAAVWEAEFDSLQGVYFTKLEDYKKQQLILNDERRKQREDELRQLEQALEEAKTRLQAQADKRRDELVGPILQKILGVVQSIATNEDYDFILNVSQTFMTPVGMQFSPVMHAKKKLDLTDRVFEELAKIK